MKLNYHNILMELQHITRKRLKSADREYQQTESIRTIAQAAAYQTVLSDIKKLIEKEKNR